MHKTRKDLIEFLTDALAAAGESMRSASLKLGLNHSYLSQFMKESEYSPDVLPEEVRKDLATLLNTPEENLRVSPSGVPFVNAIEGNGAHASNHTARTASESRAVLDRRNQDMRIDRLYEEVGRIKERLDRLENGKAAPGRQHRRKPSARP